MPLRLAARSIHRFSLVPALAFAVASPALAGTAADPNPWTMCAKATNRVERQEGIPRQLLRAISKAESGRFHGGKQVVMAWPWTVMAEGRGRYLETKAEAIAEVEGLQARGIKNIDVGCMQINLMHHRQAFGSLDEAFDPLTNVRYAASFLKTLAADQGSWAKAAAYYHSQNPDRYRGYRSKVREIWAAEREKYLLALDQLRSAQMAALSLASLIHVDAPLPLGHAGATAPIVMAASRTPLPNEARLQLTAATEPLPVSRQVGGLALVEPLSDLGFHRAGPVRTQVSARDQLAAR